jgi:site-specific recombinase XerD
MNERIDTFLAYLQGERSLSPNTVSAYRNDLLQFADHLRSEAERQGGSGFALATIDRDMIAGYFLHLRDRGYSAASIARKTAALRSFFQYLRRAGDVPSDPTHGIGSPDSKSHCRGRSRTTTCGRCWPSAKTATRPRVTATTPCCGCSAPPA